MKICSVPKFILIICLLISGCVFAQESEKNQKFKEESYHVTISSDSMALIIKKSREYDIKNITYNPKKLKFRKIYNRNGKIEEEGYFIKKELVNGKRYIYGNSYNLISIQEIENYIIKEEERVIDK
jgi:hypothetical protein